MDEMVENSHPINLTANEVFILSVQATIKDGKKGFQIRLNCNEMLFLAHTMPLPYTSVDNIHVRKIIQKCSKIACIYFLRIKQTNI